ncbi:putative signal peptide and transmembrane protein [Rhodopirellula islandica]|uniref:Signal peptide and transmembrane protein n=1 Tax=Rhodopirellula islandica TaxID=595434 RepID=A0A0J1B588_RHOIS|nr:ABC transporter permease [Rhodopirellula islandica]KLU01778.1 putative signal peptide and transmembrane protein [Rhodopirellula islandica]
MATSLDAFAYPAVSRPRSAFQHLVWKDFRMLQTLLLAGVIGTAALFFLAVLRAAIDPVSDPSLATLSVLWVLLPNLVALGIPPISLGTENEERTLDWLRTLPVTWSQVLLSKLLVGFAAWALAVLIATACFVLSWVVLRGEWDWGEIGRISGSESIFELMVYGVGLLICGWIAALIVRNPVGSVMLVIPLIVGLTLLWNYSIAGLVSTHFHHGVTFLEATAGQRVAILCFAVVCLVALGAVIAGLARHRLAGASDHRWQAPAVASTSAWQPSVVQVAWHAKPRPFRALLWQQVRQTRLVIGVACSLSMFAVVWGLVGGDSDIQRALIVLGWPAAQLMLGVATFHGDRRGMRQGFFADRGWSPNLIWVTRLIPTALASSFLMVLFPFSAGLDLYIGMPYGTVNLWQAFAFSVVVQTLLFLIGVLTGQWGRRPSLAFFGAPVVALLWMLPAFGLLAFYGGYTGLLWLAAGVLLFATRRLTPLVMEGVSSAAVWGRGLAYCLLALGVMCLCLFTHRWWTTPPEMPQWRKEMLAIVQEPVTPEVIESTIGVLPGTRNLELNADVYPLDRFDEGMKKIMLQTEFPNVGTADAGKMQFTIRLDPSINWSGSARVEAIYGNQPERFRDRALALEKELGPVKMMGESVSQSELYSLCVSTPISMKSGTRTFRSDGSYFYAGQYHPFDWRPLRRKALEVAAKWSTLSREQAPKFGALGELLENAETNEWIVIAGLRQIAYDQNLFSDRPLPQGEEDRMDREVFVRVVDQLASEDLRRESRQRCLIAEWQRFQTGDWSGWFDDELGNEKPFLEAPLSDPLYRLGIEQKRFERKLDVAVRTTLEQLEDGLPEWDDPELAEQRLLWGELLKDRRNAQNSLGHQELASPPRAPVFYREQDLMIDELRQMADRLREP